MRLLAKALVALVLSAAAPGGGGTPGGQIDSVSASQSQVKFTFTAFGTPADAQLDPSGLRVTMDGTAVNAAATSPGSNPPAGSADRAVMVVADTGSAAGATALAPERAAVDVFLQRLRRDVATGLATTDSKAPVTVPPSTDRAPMNTGLAALRQGSGNALSDAISTALGQLQQLPAGQHRLVVIANGDDTASKPGSLAAVSQQLAQDRVPVDVIAYKTAPASLTKLAQASGGRLLPASDPAHLMTALASAAGAFGQGLWVTASVPPSLAGRHVTVTVEDHVGTSTVNAQTAIAIPGTAAGPTAGTSAAAVPAVPAARVRSAPAGAAGPVELYVVLGLAFAAIVAVVIMVSMLAGTSRPTTLAEEIALYGTPAQRSDEDTEGSSLLKSVLGASKAVVGSGGYEERMALTLDRAGMSLKPHEWLLIRCLASVVMMALITLPAGSIPVGVVIGALLGWIATRLYVARNVSSRLNAFSDQLPDALQLIASSLRSGFSVAQSIDRLAQQDLQPLGSEMSRTLAMTRLGVSIEDALDATAERMDCKDLSWVVLAIRIQREVGGNLADIIDTTIDTMRERTRLRRHVRALSAEGRLSAYLLLALPIVVGGFLIVARPAYIQPLFSQPLGLFLLVVGGLLMAVGWVWMSSIVKVEA